MWLSATTIEHLVCSLYSKQKAYTGYISMRQRDEHIHAHIALANHPDIKEVFFR
jgi:RNA binding exosome subunit